VLVECLLYLRWVLQLPDRTVLDFLDVAVCGVIDQVEFICDISIGVHIETIKHNSLYASFTVRPEHNEDHAVLRPLSIVILAITDLVLKAIVQHVIKVKGKLILSAVLPADQSEIEKVKQCNEELLEVILY
jgi:hypothetical protein